MRPSWVEVDLEAIEHNVRTIAGEVAPARFCAVVKADGYGHGDVPVAEAAVRAGATWLAVALVEEGVRLREAGIEVPILLLSEPTEDAVPYAVRWNLTPTVYRTSTVKAVSAAASAQGRTPYPVHCKIDTGMHRVGATLEVADEVMHAVDDDPALGLEGVWTHFAVAEEDPDFTTEQLELLLALKAMTEGAGIQVGMWHAANTAGALAREDARLDMVRVGLGTYGLRPEPSIGADLRLRPAMRIMSQVSHVQRLAAGERASYGRVRPMPADGNVATVPIGYADGYTRRLTSEGGEVIINGKRYPLAGTVTMDQIVVDVGDDPVAIGDDVVVLGASGDVAVTADEWADRLGTINYEVVCDWGPRLPRRYIGGSA